MSEWMPPLETPLATLLILLIVNTRIDHIVIDNEKNGKHVNRNIFTQYETIPQVSFTDSIRQTVNHWFDISTGMHLGDILKQ